MSPAKKLIALAGLLGALAVPATAQADFGLIPDTTTATALNRNGTIDEAAGSHPGTFAVHLELNTDSGGNLEGGEMRDTVVDSPAGLIGNPSAVPACPRQTFEGGSSSACPINSQIGSLRATVPGIGQILAPIYNIPAPPGIATMWGFSLAGRNAFQYASVRTEDGYVLRVSSVDVPLPVTDATETIWGVPADPANDPERFCGGTFYGCKSTAPLKPYLVMPAHCDSPLETDVQVDSKLNPGVFSGETAFSLDAASNPAPLAGCDAVPFNPEIASQPTSKLATNPSGLDFTLKLPDQGLESPGATAETEPEKVVTTLPEGVAINPSFASGIDTCSEAQYAAEKVESKAGAGCPEGSKIGSVIAHTPLLEEPVEGSLYLATPYQNPFGTLAALYLVGRAPESGIFVKQAGKVEMNQSTGQITTTFDHLPPLPYSTFRLHFREGARAPLSTPQACGEYETTALLTPFSSDTPVERRASFRIEHGSDGGACPAEGTPPFKPGLIAGSINNAAGRFSDFNVRLFRTDAEQEITHFSIKLPPGVVGKLAGIPFCSEAGIAQAKARERLSSGGQAEIDHPSCPIASQIGHSLVGVGVGSALTYVPGRIFLAGPYHGSAISVVAITPAKVGPFDVGTVVVRQALRVEPETGEVFIDATGSDPIPHIVSGVPVRLRDIRAYVDRPEFTLNPSGCEPTSTASTLLGSGTDFASEADDRPVTVSTRYQAADCSALPFKPKLSLKLTGSTRRGGNPALHAVLRMHGIGEAGVKRAQVTLPRSEFIDNAHFETICTRAIFKQGDVPGEKCPSGSIYGHASATTPILSEALSGPVYLRSSEHELPDVVVSLHSGEINVVLDGRVDSVKGKLRTTFEATPDAPVTSATFDFSGAKKGLFENSTNLCAGTHKAIVAFTGHNGKEHDFNPAVKATGCGGSHHKAHRRAKRAFTR